MDNLQQLKDTSCGQRWSPMACPSSIRQSQEDLHPESRQAAGPTPPLHTRSYHLRPRDTTTLEKVERNGQSYLF